MESTSSGSLEIVEFGQGLSALEDTNLTREEGDLFTVEFIQSKRIRRGVVQYLVKWEGFENT